MFRNDFKLPSLLLDNFNVAKIKSHFCFVTQHFHFQSLDVKPPLPGQMIGKNMTMRKFSKYLSSLDRVHIKISAAEKLN